MPAPPCSLCSSRPSVLVRPKNGVKLCSPCFTSSFESEVHDTIVTHRLFVSGDRVAIGASGGKDSTVLAHVLVKLNRKYEYGCELILISVDEGIKGYRDDSLEAVKRNQSEFGIPLKIVSYQDLYGWTMDDIVAQIGTKNNCTVCGVFRRQSLDRGAMLMGCNKVATGHNADDMAETVLMNVLRGDIGRLDRCVDIVTATAEEDSESLPRCKPFKYAYEKEIVMYAYYNHIEYFSTECHYAPFAYRGFARSFLKDLERSDSRCISLIVESGESMRMAETKKERRKAMGKCKVCGFISSNEVCKACVLLRGLNEGKAIKMMGNTTHINVEVEMEADVKEGREEMEEKGYKGKGKGSSQSVLSLSAHPQKKKPVSAPLLSESHVSSIAVQNSTNIHDW